MSCAKWRTRARRGGMACTRDVIGRRVSPEEEQTDRQGIALWLKTSSSSGMAALAPRRSKRLRARDDELPRDATDAELRHQIHKLREQLDAKDAELRVYMTPNRSTRQRSDATFRHTMYREGFSDGNFLWMREVRLIRCASFHVLIRRAFPQDLVFNDPQVCSCCLSARSACLPLPGNFPCMHCPSMPRAAELDGLLRVGA